MKLLQTPRVLASRVVRRVTGAPSPLAGRTVMVTGASSGIGEATACAVARRGAHVLLACATTRRSRPPTSSCGCWRTGR